MNGAKVPLVRQVETRVVRPEWATRVVSPAYDSVRPQQREELMANDPYVFLHVTRSPADGDTMTSEELGAANAVALDRLIDADVFTEVAGPGLYLYQLRRGDHVQTAVVADVAVAGFADGRVLPHERVRPQRSALLADHLEQIGVNSSPIALGYRDDANVDQLVATVLETEPLVDFERPEDQLGQSVWVVPDEIASQLVACMADLSTYILDGHHRAAASLQLWDRWGRGDRASRVLCALFPNSQLRVAAFHRRVGDLNGHSVESLLGAIGEMGFAVSPVAEGTAPEPEQPGEFSLYVDHRWYQLVPTVPGDPGFDATTLQQRILEPVLAVDETGADARLEYLPGNQGISVATDAVDDEGGAAFALHPVLFEHLMAVSDAGLTLPPKSTYFEPKVRSGVFVSPRT